MRTSIFAPGKTPDRFPSETKWVIGPGLRTAMLTAAVAVFTAVVLSGVPTSWMGWESTRIIVVVIALFICLYLVLGSARSRLSYPKRAAFAFWAFLLVSERLFLREGSNEAEFQSHFSLAAYGEAIFWVLSLLILIVIWSGQPQSFRRLFSGHYKWVTFFGVSCLIACAYTPRPMFALAWTVKLWLVILLLQLCSGYLTDLRDVVSFLTFTCWATAFITLQPVVLAFFGPSMFDEEGRLGTIVAADGLSEIAGILLLLALTLHSRNRGVGLRKAAVVLGIAGFVIMVLGGGKAAIIGGLVSGALFFLLRKGFSSSLGFTAVALVVGCLLVFLSPVGRYLQDYGKTGGLTTFTGRTEFWAAVIPLGWQKPILGHGYLAASFVAIQNPGFDWQPNHMHNGFLEAFYNNGLTGLVLILMVHVIIVYNLIRAIRRAPPTHFRYQLAVGCLAVYANLLIGGFFNASFGGRAWSFFMLLLALVIVSEKLVNLESRPELAEAQTAEIPDSSRT